MAHFAELDENNVVKQVIVVSNGELLDENGIESEEKGIAFCQSLFGGNWVQTSYNDKFRLRFASVGFSYDSMLDIFIPLKPLPSWILDTETYDWVPPIPRPDSGLWVWDEPTVSWKEQDIQ